MNSIWDPEQLVKARNDVELSVIDASNRLSITPEYLSMLENGHKQPSSKLINNMCDLYRQTAAFFLRQDQQIVKS